jgi:hypothetical protein
MNHYYYIQDIDTWRCTNSFYKPVDGYLEDAFRKNISFTKTMRGCFFTRSEGNKVGR